MVVPPREKTIKKKVEQKRREQEAWQWNEERTSMLSMSLVRVEERMHILDWQYNYIRSLFISWEDRDGTTICVELRKEGRQFLARLPRDSEWAFVKAAVDRLKGQDTWLASLRESDGTARPVDLSVGTLFEFTISTFLKRSTDLSRRKR
jgi:hypothetical protein